MIHLKSQKIIPLVATLFSLTLVYAQGKPDALKSYMQGNYTQAISICENELLSSPNNLDSYAVLCWSLVGNKQYAEAEQRAIAARKVNAYDMRIIEVLAEAKYYLGKNNEALALFEQYISGVPITSSRVGSAYYYMGEIFIRQKKYQSADISLTTACRMEVLLDYWWTRLGYAREMCREYETAIEAYNKAINLNPSREESLRGRARCQEQIR